MLYYFIINLTINKEMDIALLIIKWLFLYAVTGTFVALFTTWLNKKYPDSMRIDTEKAFNSMYLWTLFAWPTTLFMIAYLLVYYYNFKYGTPHWIQKVAKLARETDTNYQHITALLANKAHEKENAN